MTDDIDYEALAKAARSTWDDRTAGGVGPDRMMRGWTAIARAVVAALREQGFVVVRRYDVGLALEWGSKLQEYDSQWIPAADDPAFDRLGNAYTATLVAPGDGAEVAR